LTLEIVEQKTEVLEVNDIITPEQLWEDIDDSRFTPEHRIYCSILLKAIKEAMWKRVVITYKKGNNKVVKSFYSRCNNAVVYLKDTERDDETSVLTLCELFGIRHSSVLKLIEMNPCDYETIEEAKFIFNWVARLQTWRPSSSHRKQIYGEIFRKFMFEVKI
jgi:predicted site-specific integrase-resolvase